MKSLVSFINETLKDELDEWNKQWIKNHNKPKSKQTPFDFIYNNFMSGAEEYADAEPEAKTFIKQVKDLIKKFIKENGITSSNQIKVESSTPDYWEDFINGIDIEENTDLEDMDVLKVSYDEIFSCELKGNKLYMTSQTGTGMNGDYFDAVFSKK